MHTFHKTTKTLTTQFMLNLALLEPYAPMLVNQITNQNIRKVQRYRKYNKANKRLILKIYFQQ